MVSHYTADRNGGRGQGEQRVVQGRREERRGNMPMRCIALSLLIGAA